MTPINNINKENGKICTVCPVEQILVLKCFSQKRRM